MEVTANCDRCAHRILIIWIIGLCVVLLGVAACRRGAPVIDPAANQVQAPARISGTVRGPQGTTAIDARAIEAVNLSTGERRRTTTNGAGGFSFRLEPGKYRVELTLREGESLVKQPGIINVDNGSVDTRADFVLGASRAARPLHRAPRGGDGLGSAIA